MTSVFIPHHGHSWKGKVLSKLLEQERNLRENVDFTWTTIIYGEKLGHLCFSFKDENEALLFKLADGGN